MHRNHPLARRSYRGVVAVLWVGIALSLAGCASPAQTFRDKAPAFGLTFELASDETIDLYGRTACDGGREALGRLLAAESDSKVDVVYALAVDAYCPE